MDMWGAPGRCVGARIVGLVRSGYTKAQVTDSMSKPSPAADAPGYRHARLSVGRLKLLRVRTNLMLAATAGDLVVIRGLALSAPVQIVAVLIPPFGAATWLEHRGVPRVLAIAAGLTFAPAVAMAVRWLTWLTMPARLPAELAGWAVLAIGASLALLTVARGQWAIATTVRYARENREVAHDRNENRLGIRRDRRANADF